MGDINMAQRSLIQKLTSGQAVFVMALAAAMVIASAITSIVSAASLVDRSITPTSSAAGATGVEYTVEFTPETDAGAFVIEFCDNTPLLGQSCVAPSGFSVADAETTTANVTLVEASQTANKLVATKAMTADAKETMVFTGVTNPSDVGSIYARIVTYTDSAAAEGYVSDNPSAVAEPIDSGSVAMYFTSSVAVSGNVLETLMFCVSSEEIEANCAGANSPATLELGETDGGVTALQAGVVSTNVLHVQMNTNASSGAIVHLKSSAQCGGLQRQGTDECDIAAAMQQDIDGSAALFGIKLAGAQGGANAVGSLVPAIVAPDVEPYYSTEEFAFRYDDTHARGVTSPFGDPFLDTAGAPATNQNMELTFGATITNETPAGTYSTDLSMIAVGKF